MIGYARYRHISFDLWLTLIRSDPRFKQHRTSLIKSHFDIPLEERVISDCVKNKDVLFNTINEKTGRNLETEEMWWLILPQLGIDIAHTDPALVKDFIAKSKTLFLEYPPQLIDEATGDILKKLRKHDITLSILSNTAFIKGAELRQLLDNIGIGQAFDFQVYSDETGYSKPHPEIFQVLFTEANRNRPVEKRHILHFGDNKIADVKGARDFGIDAELFSPQTQKLSDCFVF